MTTTRLRLALLCGGVAAVLSVGCEADVAGPHTEVQPTEVWIEDYHFSPFHKYVQPGATVTWINRDPVPHAVVSGLPSPDERGRAFDTGIIRPGDSASVRFPRMGAYSYHCALHTNLIRDPESDIPILFVRPQWQTPP